ncbi:MAG TPA: UbiH/UbiF/VisC/COQ6 family ubiquinone biosynthesis hydroxylase [Alphaproteobacteria bacterium]|nr:UbiH/UbiF/VisC/COQ6 family ubiquinone biosynthesis hydroxylase [Alphaproteobacteria bacterium]
MPHIPPRSSSDPIRVQVLVVGGGPAGLALAAALGTGGVETAIIDRESAETRTNAGFDGRTTAMTYGSIRVLDGIGAWAALEPQACPILATHVVDGRSPLFLHVEGDEIGDHPYGYNIENGWIRKALIDRLAACPTVTDLSPATIAGFERTAGGVVAVLEDGRRVQADLLVGADGRRSAVRTWAGIDANHWTYDQIAIVCTVEHDRPHGNVAVENLMPSGPFALVPMIDAADGRHRTAIVWCERKRNAPAYLDLGQAAFEAELQRRCGERLGEVRQIGRRFSYPLSGLHARRYTADRVALMGEAAHAVHPIAAQGLNLSMRDAAALAEIVVDRHRLGLDVGAVDALARYQRWRRFDNLGVIAYTDTFFRAFSNSIPPLKLGRNLALAAIDRLKPVKRAIIRDAMGLSGRPPRLVRGEAL